VSTLIVTSVVVVYAIASMAYVASSEQRATRHRRRDRARRRSRRPLPNVPRPTMPRPSLTMPRPSLTLPRPSLTMPRPSLTLPDWLQAPPDEALEFIRAAPLELEPTGMWPRVRSSAALLVLLPIVGAVVAIVLGLAAVLMVLALKNAAG
jgi:hypothetical protein